MRAEEFIDHVGNLLVRAVAGDDIRLGEQTRVLGERLQEDILGMPASLVE